MPPSSYVASSLGGGEEDNLSLQLQQHQKKLSPERKKGEGDMKNQHRTFVARWRRGVKQERSYTARWRRSPDTKKVNHETQGGSTGPGAESPTNSAARQPPTPRGFSDWSASNSAFTSLAVQSPPSSNAANAYHYSMSPCYAFWTHYMLNKNAYSYYPAPNQEHNHPFYHDNNQAKDPGSVPSFGLESFSTTSLAPNMSAHMPPMEMPPMEGPLSAKEPEISEDVPARVVRIKDEMETRHGIDLKCETVDTLPELKQGQESCATKFNSGEYQVILRKELTKSDVANVGRIVLPKKDAEASLPPLCERDPLILQMDDMVLPVTWKFKYRFWPNNKSRMYILDSTTEFVKTHGLQAGDSIIIYKNPVPGKYIVRGEKAIQQTTNH